MFISGVTKLRFSIKTEFTLSVLYFLQDNGTALKWAAMNGRNNIINYLIDHGARVDDVDRVSKYHCNGCLIIATYVLCINNGHVKKFIVFNKGYWGN